jgi:hypothetical protein
MKMAVFWVVAPCSLAIALMMTAASTSEAMVNFYHATRRTTQKTAIFILGRCEKLKSHQSIFFLGFQLYFTAWILIQSTLRTRVLGSRNRSGFHARKIGRENFKRNECVKSVA